MPSVFNLYNKYIYINGRWEKLSDPGSSGGGSSPILTFTESMSATDFLALNLADLDVGSSYNVIDSFTTDARFIEGVGTVVPAETCVTVIMQGTNKYFNILGSTFNIDYIQSQINNILTILDSLSLEWDNISDKPFQYIGEGLSVNSNNELNASQLLHDIAALQRAVASINLTWTNISGKPFSEVGTSMKVVNDKLEIGDVDWDDILNKPFETLSSQFVVNNDELEIDFIEWEKVSNKPFDTFYSGDFYIQTLSNQTRRLRIDDSYKDYEFYEEDLITLRNIINS